MSIDWHAIFIPDRPLLDTIVRASLVYLVVQFLLRLTGRKELSRYSSFDLTFIFLLTQAVRRAITVDDGSVTGAVVALTTLIGWNLLFSWISFRSRLAAKILKGTPQLLMQDGAPLEHALRVTRLGVEEIKAELRTYGTQDFTAVRQAYLETNGRITFVLLEGPGTRTRG
jgi:uncharacterized membrane protein YcaP (DUF421 family)